MNKRISFLGLGVMGYPMAGWLARAGHSVVVYNRTAAVTERWLKEYSGTAADSPTLAVANAEIIFSCLGNDSDVRDVLLAEQGALTNMQPGSILVDHTTPPQILPQSWLPKPLLLTMALSMRQSLVVSRAPRTDS